MALGDDMNTMAGLADALVDEFMGGHTDALLATFMPMEHGLYRNAKPVIRLLVGLVAELINKRYDLEVIQADHEERIVVLET